MWESDPQKKGLYLRGLYYLLRKTKRMCCQQMSSKRMAEETSPNRKEMIKVGALRQ